MVALPTSPPLAAVRSRVSIAMRISVRICSSRVPSGPPATSTPLENMVDSSRKTLRPLPVSKRTFKRTYCKTPLQPQHASVQFASACNASLSTMQTLPRTVPCPIAQNSVQQRGDSSSVAFSSGSTTAAVLDGVVAEDEPPTLSWWRRRRRQRRGQRVTEAA